MSEQPQWEDIHQELALTAELLQTDLDPRQLSALLAQRAQQFATQVQSATRHEQRHFLSFSIGNETYGMDVETVETIVPLRHITPVPDAPPFFAGVANVKGQMITLLHLPRLFGLSNTDTASAKFIVVVRGGGLTMGVLTDAVREVVAVQDEQLAHHASDDPSLIAILPGRVALLDADYLFADARIRPEGGTS